MPSPDPDPGAGAGQDDTPASRDVPTLPILNYMEKVDAWRANQSAAGRPLPCDSPAPQGGGGGVAPKKRAYDTISDSLNRILSQQGRPDSAPSGAPAQRGTDTTASSSPRRGGGPGSGPASRSHSSLSTVVGWPRPSPLAALGRFSDVSVETDARGTLSPAQDARRDPPRLLGASTGPSSVVSLEVDHYAPYWTSSQPVTPPPPTSAPPRTRELNIEERIPVGQDPG